MAEKKWCLVRAVRGKRGGEGVRNFLRSNSIQPGEVLNLGDAGPMSDYLTLLIFTDKDVDDTFVPSG